MNILCFIEIQNKKCVRILNVCWAFCWLWILINLLYHKINDFKLLILMNFDFQISLRSRGRSLVLTDVITKTTKHSNINHSYHFHLFNDILIYSKKKLNTFRLKRVLRLSHMEIADLPLSKNSDKSKSKRSFVQIVNWNQNKKKKAFSSFFTFFSSVFSRFK